ncbi:MAG: hypothetical protein JRJ84_14175 [Deltaproteobacteria bacterium]|nr:hypothetical protein [Deltaproteobacteria bacterium]
MLPVVLLAALALAQDVGAPPESRRAVRWAEPEAPAPDDGLTFIGIVRSKAVLADMGTSNPLLDGQVVGLLGGLNGTLVDPELKAFYVEQRLGAYATWAPPILDGRVAMALGFEIDFAWGDASYGVGGNTGGGFGADQVNLQTQRLHLTVVALDVPGHEIRVHAGLQFLPDGAFDPTRSTPDDLFRTGGGLRFFGSEAAGLSAYGRVRDGFGDRLLYRLGSFVLHEEGMALADDVTLHVADARWQPTWATGFGLHLWYLRDRSLGRAGTLGVGHTSLLSELQGGPDLDLRPGGTGTAPEVNADLLWIGLDAGYNHRLDRGPLGVTGLVLAHPGRLYVTDQRDYTGLTTGNSYGVVGALNPIHGCLLLFPDPFSINRYVSVAHDLSNQGDGLLGLSATAGWDPVPNRMTVEVGAGHARDGDGLGMGTEVNARVHGEPFLFLDLGLQGGVVLGTDLAAPPWIVYASLDWIAF